MSVSAGSAVLDIVPGLDKFDRHLRSGIDPGVNRAADHAEKRLGGAFRNIAGIAAGIGAGVTAVNFFKGAFDEAEEARKAMAQTQAVIKSTGGIANVTAADIDRLSGALSNKAGIDDELIASGANVLLTFTKIRNEAGAGNDVFNQANAAALDLSVALKTDLSSASMLVGKALNDPIAGLTALTRSGIQFTDQQKDQIKAMVAAGDQLGAQKIILAELNTQFGGSAAAAASPLARLRVAFDNIKESVGSAFLPAMQGAASFLADSLPVAVDSAGKAFGRIKDIIGPVVTDVTAAVRTMFASFKGGDGDAASAGFARVMERIGSAARTVVEWFRANWPQIQTVVSGVIREVVAFVQANWPSIRDTIVQTMETVRSVITNVVTIIQTIWRNFGDEIMAVITTACNYIRGIIQAAMQVIQGVINVVTGIITGDWGQAWEGIKQIFSGVWDAIKNTLSTALEFIQSAISVAWEVVKGIVTGAWDAIKGIFTTGWNFLKNIFIDGVAFIVEVFLGAAENILKTAARMLGWVPGIGPKLKEAAAAFESFRDDVNASLQGLKDKTVRVNVSPYASDEEVAKSTGTARRTAYATGGQVAGPGGTDNVPAWLTSGEWVMNKDAVAHYGPRFMDAINAKKFASGGMVGVETSLPGVGPWMEVISAQVERLTDATVSVMTERLRKEAAAASAAAGVDTSGAPVSGLTAAASAMVNAVRNKFPDQTMTSGYRSPAENARVGGAPNSDHMYGRAADFAPGSNALASFLRAYPGIKQVLWQEPGHWDHVHGATTMHTGGIVGGPSNRDVQINAQGGEGVFTREQMAALGGPKTVRVEIPVMLNGRELAREVREVVLFEQRDMAGAGAWER